MRIVHGPSVVLYEYVELSDEAKVNALEHVHETRKPYMQEALKGTVEKIVTMAEHIGFNIEYHSAIQPDGKHADVPSVYYYVDQIDGGYCCFDGSYTYKADAVECAGFEVGPNADLLRGIVVDLNALQKSAYNELEASTDYTGDGCWTIYVYDQEGKDNSGNTEEEDKANILRLIIDDFAGWAYRELRDEWDKLQPQGMYEAFALSMGAMFTVDGHYYEEGK